MTMRDKVAQRPEPLINSAYPEGFPALSALSFVALGWVVLNQFRDHLGLHAGERIGLVGKGYLGAELFFVLSGFLLCHVYSTASERGQFNYGSFVWNRVARTYPLHVAMIGLMAGIYLAARATGSPFSARAFDPWALPANFTLLHAWGVLPTVSWNFPSWLISADFFAVLVFPLTARLALNWSGSLILALAAPVALFVALFEIADARGVLFTDMTAQIGGLQTIPAYLWGAALYRLHRAYPMGARTSFILAIAAGGWIVAAALFRTSDLAIWPAFGVLVLGLASLGKAENSFQGANLPRVLGQVALSMYLVYLPVDILYFHGIAKLLGTPTGAMAWLAWVGVFPAILIAGALAYWSVERPTWRWLTRL